MHLTYWSRLALENVHGLGTNAYNESVVRHFSRMVMAIALKGHQGTLSILPRSPPIDIKLSAVLQKPFISLSHMVYNHSLFLQGELVAKKKGKKGMKIKHAETAADQMEAERIIKKILTENHLTLSEELDPNIDPALFFYQPGDASLKVPKDLLI